MFYSLYAHRQSKGAVAANFHESTKAELVWTVVPIIILIGMAYQHSINSYRHSHALRLCHSLHL
jgi:heme/copper-type cytochrome/quinol oxidase subunit 2